MKQSYNFKEDQIKDAFEKKYHSFKYFFNDEYTFLRTLCFNAAQDDELLSHIIFCNDVFHIPPVRTFLVCFKAEIKDELGTINLNTKKDGKQKRALGAFWGTIFKGLLGYSKSLSITVPLSDFEISTASYFFEKSVSVE